MFDDTAARERLEALLVCEPSTADRAELDRIVSLCAGVKSMVAAVEVAVARRSRQLQTSPAGESAADVLAGGRQSRREARAAAERERACAAMPSFEEALSAGAVSAGHVDALARATRGLDDATTSAVS
ncbi:MAG: hypothetical protein ACRDZZ_09335, partial [Ilumatobacteraceae bacterium]